MGNKHEDGLLKAAGTKLEHFMVKLLAQAAVLGKEIDQSKALKLFVEKDYFFPPPTVRVLFSNGRYPVAAGRLRLPEIKICSRSPHLWPHR